MAVSKAELAIEYRKEYGMKMPTLKLARIMYKDNNLLFKNVESARDALRYIENKRGGNPHSANKEFFMDGERPKNPYNLPVSHQEKREPFRLPKLCNNVLIISDIHIPYHDIEAVTIALDYGVQHKVNTIYINGDLIDFAGISKFEPDLKKRSVKEEFDATKNFLKVLRATFPTANIYWAKGNHCIRWEKFLMAKVREIWDDPYFSLEERLALNEEKITLIDDKVLVKMGKLTVAHGHHIFKGFSSPVNPARGAFNKAKQTIMVGHLHRPSHSPEVTSDGDVISCWSTGCLCELRPSYSPQISNSLHGFAHVTVENNGDYTVRNYQIIKGKVH